MVDELQKSITTIIDDINNEDETESKTNFTVFIHCILLK